MRTLLSLLGLSLVAVQAVQAEDFSKPHISVAGTAVTEAVPDRLIWSLEVKTVQPELSKAAETQAKRVASLLELLTGKGVTAENMQTANMEFGENMVYAEREYVKQGYFAQTEVTCKTTDLAAYKDLWIALAGQSGVSVKGVAYDHSKAIELRKDTRKKALLAAKEKAQAMAETLGAKLGRVLAISEDLNASQNPVSSRLSAANYVSNAVQAEGTAVDPELGAAIAPGTVPIRIRVLVSFELEGGK